MNIDQLLNEIRAGRVLSASNERKLREAVERLSEVLAQLGEEENASAPRHEQRTFAIADVEVRATEQGAPLIRGHAAVFNKLSVFLYGFRERIAPGAFAESIDGGDIRALWQHDSAKVLGRTTNDTLKLWEDELGLAFELTPPATQDGRDALTLIGRGDVDQMSFGFTVPLDGDSWAEEEGMPIRTLRRVNLMEISPVTWAAYPDTGVSVMRSAPEWVQRALQPQGVDEFANSLARARDGKMLELHDLLYR
jgi:HK97 family phage prohead protease